MSEVTNEKIQGALKVLLILQLVGYVFATLSSIFLLVFHDYFVSVYESLPNGDTLVKSLSPTALTISLVFSLLNVIFLALILKRKALGIYGFFTVTIISFIQAIIFQGHFSPISLLSLVIPIITALLIHGKKHLFFGDVNSNTESF